MDLTINSRETELPPYALTQHQSKSLISIWILFLVSSIVMVLRILSQFRILRIVRADDVLMIIAWILQAAKSALSTISIYWGLGRHDWQLASSEAFVKIMKFGMYSMIVGSLCGLFGRISFAAFLLYFIQRVSRAKAYVLWIVIVVQVVVNILFLTYDLVKCAPSVHGPRATLESAACWTSPLMMALQYSQGAINAASNLCLTILALNLVCGIHVARYAKASLCTLLSFSLLAILADVLAIVEVSRTRRDGTDYAYRLNTWNNWYSIENAVIIITGSMAKLRPVTLLVYHYLKDSQAVEKLRKWSESKTSKKGRTKFLRFVASYPPTSTSRRSLSPNHPTLPPPPSPSITVTTTDEESTALRRFQSRNSIYSKRCRKNGHSRHWSNATSNATSTISLSSFPHYHSSSSTSHPYAPSTTTTAGACDKDLAGLAQTSSSITSRDFAPISSPRLTYQTVITAGDPSSVPPPFLSLLSSPPTRTPNSSTTTTSGRTSRNRSSSTRREKQQQQQLHDGFTTTNSSLLFLPTLNNSQSPGLLLPILQTSHFSIEYEDGNDADTRSESDNNSTNANPNDNKNSETSHRHNRSRDVELGWTTMRHDNHRDEMARACNDDEADALQLHDVGSILSGF